MVTVWAEGDGPRRVVTLAEFDGADGAQVQPPQRRPAASDEAVLDVVRDWLSAGADPPLMLRVVEEDPRDW